MSDQWSERLSEYVDGHLTDEEVRRLEEHLGACPSCRTAVDELRAVVARARSLEDRPPPRDLWPAIESKLEDGAEGGVAADVVELDVARRSRGGRVRRVVLSIPQLAAAAVALLVVGSAATWAAAPALRGGPGEGVPVAGAGEAGGAISAVSAGAAAADPAMAREMAALEETLARRRDRLDPNTVRIVEKNLAVIDRAIRESRAALDVDPGNPFLEEHLEGAVERRLDYLREATRLLRTS